MIKFMQFVTDGAAEAQKRARSCPKSHSKPTADPESEPGSPPPSLAPLRSSRWYASGSYLSVPRVWALKCRPDTSLMPQRGLDVMGWHPQAGP